jgi:REP element-mobilizing transposase RayT
MVFYPMPCKSTPERGTIAVGDRPHSIRLEKADEAAPTSALPGSHVGWHSRGYLPHLDAAGLTQSVTFRLADSLPGAQAGIWSELARLASDAKRRALAEAWLDRGHGSCVLREPDLAAFVENALLCFDGQRCRVLAWVVMPNHVHVLVGVFPSWPLRSLVKSWKSYTARAINDRLGRRGALWQADYFDRFIRDDDHLRNEIDYIEENPVKAGLVAFAADWPWSSASRKRSADVSPSGDRPA